MALGKQLREARERHGLTASQVAAATRMKMQIVEAIEREDFGKIAAPIYGKGFIKLYAELVGVDPRPLLQEYAERLSAATKTPSLVSEGTGRRAAAEASHAASGNAPAHPAAAPLRPDESLMQFVADEGAEAAASSEPAAIEEPDLFSHATRRSQEARQPERPPPSAPPVPEPSPAKAPPAAPPAPAVPDDSASRMAALNLWQSPIRAASIVLGLVLLILLVISTLSRCVVSPKPAQGSMPRPELQVVINPPEPYFE